MDLSLLLFIALFLLCINYIAVLILDQANHPTFAVQEGYVDAKEETTTTGGYLENDDLFDEFYASVYDQLFQNSVRLQAQIGLLLHQWTSRSGIAVESMRILDAGCGTGVASVAFAKMNVNKVIALDKSAAMIERAKTVTVPSSTLTEEQKKRIEFRVSDLYNPSALSATEVTHAVMFYFTPYYLKDLEAALRNLYVWVAPGGKLAIEVVNKHKFDPMLEPAAPWLAFSLQKYSKERVTKSSVTFDKFVYEANFDLEDPEAEFRETFRFKDGRVRRQRHRLYMQNIDAITKLAMTCGWKYDTYIDLTTIGFEYAYLLCFTHP